MSEYETSVSIEDTPPSLDELIQLMNRFDQEEAMNPLIVNGRFYVTSFTGIDISKIAHLPKDESLRLEEFITQMAERFFHYFFQKVNESEEFVVSHVTQLTMHGFPTHTEPTDSAALSEFFICVRTKKATLVFDYC